MKTNNKKTKRGPVAIKLSEAKIKAEKFKLKDPIWRMIQRPSLGLLFGPAKSGKTIFSETLAYNIITEEESFLGSKINDSNLNIVFISLEEFFPVRYQLRLKKQIKTFSKEKQAKIENQFIIPSSKFPTSLSFNEEDNSKLEKVIKFGENGLIIIDSTDRFSKDISEKKGANIVTQYLRKMSVKYQCAIMLLHHTTKIQELRPITMNSMSGSAALSRDVDYMIAINKIGDNTRYLKEIDSRYSSVKPDVFTFEISDGLFKKASKTTESNLLSSLNATFNKESYNLVLRTIKNELDKGEKSVRKKHIVDTLKLSHNTSESTVTKSLKKLVEDKLIKAIGNGKYIIETVDD